MWTTAVQDILTNAKLLGYLNFAIEELQNHVRNLLVFVAMTTFGCVNGIFLTSSHIHIDAVSHYAAGVVPAAHFSPGVHSPSKHKETFSKVASTEAHLHPHHIPGVPVVIAGPLQLAPLQHQLHGWGRSTFSRLGIF